MSWIRQLEKVAKWLENENYLPDPRKKRGKVVAWDPDYGKDKEDVIDRVNSKTPSIEAYHVSDFPY